jgi:diacylglycerol kinase family enzyme
MIDDRQTMRGLEGRQRNDELSRLRWQTVPAPERPVLFINPRSGGGTAAGGGLADHARERGVDVVVLRPGQRLGQLAADAVARGADALGMAGGDGSLAIVAAAAGENELPFICIPAGTRNHFARDVGVDRSDVLGALDAFTDALERRIDVAEVNGRVFLNNVSLGIYGDAVQRPEYRDAKLRTLLESVDEVLGPSGTADELHVVDDLGREHTHPAVVLVSNNPYALEGPLVPGARPRLDSGVLGVVVLDARPVGPHPPMRAWTTASLEVGGPGPVRAGIDGEAGELRPPMIFRTRPMALRVRISSRHPGVPPPGRSPLGRRA